MLTRACFRNALTLALSALACAGCFDSHALESPGDAGVTMGDQSVMADMGPPTDQGLVFCRVDHSIRTLQVPTLASGAGFDLDGGGSELGCGQDGPGGVDNALDGLATIFMNFGANLNSFLDLAISIGAVRLAIRIDECGPTPTISVVDRNGTPVSDTAPLTIAPGGAFEGVVSELPISIPIPFGPGGNIDFTAEDVNIGGVISPTDGELQDVELGGHIPGERLVALAETFGPLIGGFDPMLIEGVLRGSLDLEFDTTEAGCDALSTALIATTSSIRFETN